MAKEIADINPGDAKPATDGILGQGVKRNGGGTPQLDVASAAGQPFRPNGHTRPHAASGESRGARPAGARKPSPTEQTHAEDFYYVKQIQAKTKLVVVLRDGEEIHGVLEWYDKTCVKVAPDREAGMVIYKAAIKYMYKESEG